MTVRNTGAAIGVAVFSMLFILAAGTASVDSILSASQQDAGFHLEFLFGFAVSLVILVSAFFSHEKEERSEPETKWAG